MREHDHEPLPGLPGELPAGETLLWQGAPHWRGFARHALHERTLALYFAALLAWYFATVLHAGLAAAALDTARFLGLALVVIAVVEGYAYLTARSTLYTITSRRIVMRFGLALPLTVNLPFKLVETAAVKLRADGSGDIVLSMVRPHGVNYLVMWPHVRPWHVFGAKPMLRAVPDAARAADLLARALAAAHAQAAPLRAAPQGSGVVRPDAAAVA